jgi:phenylacetate-CoA ligase
MRIARFLPRFREAYRLLPALEARESWSREQIEAFQLDRVNALWQRAVGSVPYYRAMQAQLDLPPRFTSLPEFQAAVPILPKERVRAAPNDFLSSRAERGRWHRTSGSTGMPMGVFWSARAAMEMRRTRYRLHAMWDHNIFDRMAFVWGCGRETLPGLEGGMACCRQAIEDRLRNRLRLPASHVAPGDLCRYLRRIAAFRPAAIYGLSRAVYLLALEAEAQNFHCDSLKFIYLTGEPAFPHLVDAIQRVFGVPALVEYGSVECGFTAGQWRDRTLRVREDIILAETVPASDGIFDIVLTVLTNSSFPLIRYAIGDTTDAPLERPPQGFAVMGSIAGRNDEIVATRSGGRLHPCVIDAVFEHEFFDAVRRYRAHQHADGSLSLTLELRSAAHGDDLARVRRRLESLLGGYPVAVDVVDLVPPSAAGKHRCITSAFQAAAPGAGHEPGRPDEVAPLRERHLSA